MFQDSFSFASIPETTTPDPNRRSTSKRPSQKKSKCTGPYCDEEFWNKKTKRELSQLESFVDLNSDTEVGTYLPNEFDGSCGKDSKFGQIYGGENAKIGEFPFIAALGILDLIKDSEKRLR